MHHLEVAGQGWCCGGYPGHPASLVGQGQDVQAVTVVFAGIVRAVRGAGAALGGDEGAVDQNDLAAPLGDLFQGTVVAEMLLPPAMSARGGSCRSTARTISAI